MNPTGQPPQGQQAAQMLAAIMQLMGQKGGSGQPSGGTGTGFATAPQLATPPPIRYNPTGAPNAGIQTAPPPAFVPMQPSGNVSVGDFATKGAATNAGLVSIGQNISALVNKTEERQHAKKAAEAEGYMLQINALLASGDPKDKEKATMFLEDPKILKALKTGLSYVPLQEEAPPPEAQGVHSAMQKIKSKMGMGGGQPQQQPGRPVIPQPSQQQRTQGAVANATLQRLQQDPASALTLSASITDE